MRGAIPPLPQHVFMASYIVKHKDSFTFVLYLYVSEFRPEKTY
jgi:hypothetical protein